MNSRRSIAALALAGLVFILAMKIPLPGIDMAAISAQASPDRGTLSRLSIFALGLMPLYTALLLVELGRLFVRSADDLPRQPGATERAIVAVIALAFTALQGYAISGGLSGSGLVDGSSASLPVLIVATFMGVTALAMFLCYRISIPGFRHAFWALWSVFVLLSLPSDMAAIAHLTRTGAISVTAWLGFLGYFLVCVAAVVVMAALWRSVCLERVETGEGMAGAFVEPREILIWPTILAGMVVQPVLMVVSFFVTDANENWLGSLRIALPIVYAILIPVIVFVYIRRDRAIIRPGAPIAAVGTGISVIQIALMVAETIRVTTLPYSFGVGSTALLALTLTVLALGKSNAQRSSS